MVAESSAMSARISRFIINAPIALLFVGAITLVALAGCAPMYRTVYDYTPPEDAASKQCLNQCLAMRQNCWSSAESIAAQGQASCQQSATLIYAACITTAKTDTDRSRCSRSSSCHQSADTSHCMGDYRQCYRNCGGTVTSRQECVHFCD